MTIAQIEQHLAQAIAEQIYPQTDIERMRSSIGLDVKVARGEPQQTELQKDLMSLTPVGWIVVNQAEGQVTDKTRYRRDWRKAKKQFCFGLEAINARDGFSTTFVGTAQTDGVAGIEIEGISYPVEVKKGQGATLVAQKISALVASIGRSTCTCIESTLTSTTGNVLVGKASGRLLLQRETGRSDVSFIISLYAPSIFHRDSMEKAVMDAVLECNDFSLAQVDTGNFRFCGRKLNNGNLNANVYGLDLEWRAEIAFSETLLTVPVMWTTGVVNDILTLGTKEGLNISNLPPLGAFRQDFWYNMTRSVDQQCATALSDVRWSDRLPINTLMSPSGSVSWPVADQAVMDVEITSAAQCGLSFWIFDTKFWLDGKGDDFSLYLSSVQKNALKFSLLVHFEQIVAGHQPEYEIYLNDPSCFLFGDGRPLLCLGMGSVDFSLSEVNIVVDYIRKIRKERLSENLSNPYVLLVPSPVCAQNEIEHMRKKVGADAIVAGNIVRSIIESTPYSDLATSVKNDWQEKEKNGSPIIPVAMMGWDRRPLVDVPQALFPLRENENRDSFYEEDIEACAELVRDLLNFSRNSGSVSAKVGLINAWNDFIEGTWLAPTRGDTDMDETRVMCVAHKIEEIKATDIFPDV